MDEPSLRDFLDRYPDEQACREHFRQHRWGDNGFECPDCGETDDWTYLESRRVFQCNTCRRQTSLTAGTILQDTKIDLWDWYLSAYLVFTTKKGISTPELARKVGYSEKTAWFVKHKLLDALREEEAKRLFGLVEVDEAFLGGRTADVDGRSTSKQQLLGAVEATDDGLGRLRLQRVEDMSKATIHGVVNASIEPGSQVHTDGWPGFSGLDAYDHHRFIPDDQYDGGRDLPRIHLVFSNLKRVIKGTHGHCSPAKLQAYLDLFCYRFDHREQLGEAFEQGLGRLCSAKPVRYREVIGAAC